LEKDYLNSNSLLQTSFFLKIKARSLQFVNEHSSLLNNAEILKKTPLAKVN